MRSDRNAAISDPYVVSTIVSAIGALIPLS